MTPRTAVITGAGGALGAAVARELAKHGYLLALVDLPPTRTPRAPFAQLADELGRSGTRAVAYDDPQDATGWTDLVARISSDLGPVSAAALVAGGWRGGSPLHEDDPSTLRTMLAMNVESAHRSLRALVATMVAHRTGGAIVVVGSRNVERPWTGAQAGAYTASKAALVALADATAAEVVGDGVRVNAVFPSTLDTPANRAAMPNVDPTQLVSLASAAKVIAFLLSDDARDVSGAHVPIYGRA